MQDFTSELGKKKKTQTKRGAVSSCVCVRAADISHCIPGSACDSHSLVAFMDICGDILMVGLSKEVVGGVFNLEIICGLNCVEGAT